MKYNDEQILDVDSYAVIAKAYSDAMKKKGYKIIQVDTVKNSLLLEEIFETMLKIKSCLFFLGGFLNTQRMYSLNDRQLKKLAILFDQSTPSPNRFEFKKDKTKCFLEFVGLESGLIKNLIALAEQSSLDQEIYYIIDDRLTVMKDTFSMI